MSWTATDLDRIGRAGEIEITTERADGTARAWVPIWVVVIGDVVAVRSYRGGAGAWYGHAVAHPHGRIRVGGTEHAVTFERPDDSTKAAIDEAYRTKYAGYGDQYLQPMLTEPAVTATLRLVPRNMALAENVFCEE